MKDIQSQIQSDVIATKLVVKISHDDLSSFANFGYQLLNENGEEIKSDMVTCDGEDYLAWKGDNEFPYTYVASKLGIQIQ